MAPYRTGLLAALVMLGVAHSAAGQQPAMGATPGYQQPSWTPAPATEGAYGYPNTGAPPYAPPYGSPYVAPVAPRPARTASDVELGTLYVTSGVYGVGMGVWLSMELGISDPATFLIPPVVLGLAAPTAVYVLNRPRMRRGMPLAVATGLAIGAGEGLGIAGYQIAAASERHDWSFRAVARSIAIGATVGGVGGYAVGALLEPPPQSSASVASGVVWGTAIGSMFGYGASGTHGRRAAALGGLIGYNVGLVAMAGLSTAVVVSWYELGWMWAGAGIGAAASLPVFLFYTGKDAPPAKRGFIFMGTAATVGLAAGALLSGTFDHVGSRPFVSVASADQELPWLTVDFAAPMVSASGVGAVVAGHWR
ncbi:MAG: hypothetical protein JW940_01615 [Polyangiaceae bacterium]|nr:hypothetical protein [Polyangiaceae bacterium]